MGILDLFRKPKYEEVRGTRVLVAQLGVNFSAPAAADTSSYLKFYPNTNSASFEDAKSLFAEIRKPYDVVHLLVEVANGNLVDSRGTRFSPADLIDVCVQSDVKLLWLAGDIKADQMRSFQSVRGKRLNLVLTLERRDPRFTNFFEQLLAKIAAGQAMPTAWVSLGSQTSSDPRHQDLPSTVFAAGRPSVHLM